MWISVKAINQNDDQKKNGVIPYAVELHFTDRMVRLGVFGGHPPSKTYVIKDMYKNGEVNYFDAAEDAADAIAEYQMGREVSKMIPVHLTPDTPD